MVLDLINKYKEEYKELLASNPNYDEEYKWESLKNFQDNWDIDAPDFEAMYDKSLSNSLSDNLWASMHYYPKSVMLGFIRRDPELVRAMFRQLFDEEQNVERRIDQFVLQCDRLIKHDTAEDPSRVNHYHSGYRIMSVYLGFRYPQTYTVYKYTEFKTFMEMVRANTIPGTNEIGRFFKVMNTLYNILIKDEELLRIHRGKIANERYYQGDTLLLAQDFYFCCAHYFK